MHTAHGAVHGLLCDTLVALQAVEVLLQIVLELHVHQVAQVLGLIALQIADLLLIGEAHVGGEVEVESGDGLSAVHLVLSSFERDTGLYRSGLDALGGARLGMGSLQTVLQDGVQRMLHAGERLCGIIVLVVDVDIAVLSCEAHILVEQIVIDERLGGLAGKLHHHACRGVGIHVGIFAGDVVLLGTNDFLKHLARLGAACDGARITIRDIDTSHFLALGTHQLLLHTVLNGFHRHQGITVLGNLVCYCCGEDGVHAFLGLRHGLADGVFDLVEIKIDSTTVAFNNFLYHAYLNELWENYKSRVAKREKAKFFHLRVQNYGKVLTYANRFFLSLHR